LSWLLLACAFAEREHASAQNAPVGPGRVNLSTGFTDKANTAPVLDLNGNGTGIDFAATFLIGDGPVALTDLDLSVQDDSNGLVSATIRLTNDLEAHRESLTVNTTGTNIVATLGAPGASRTLTLTGFDSRLAYQQVLRSASYNNTVAFPNMTERVIEFTLNDGSLQSAVAVSRVTFSWPVRITSIVRELDGDIMLTGLGVPSGVYTINASLDLNPNNFSSIGTATADSSGVWHLVDDDHLTRRFYRIAP
jgi:hypothetical protein